MKHTEIIRRPLVTEKTTTAREQGEGEVVVFEVARNATKIDVRRAVEQLFGTKVASVRTQIVHGKFKRQGRFEGQRPDWKKAWVRLKAGEKAPDFIEGT
jgi:large subunit ribosomal protein L23